MSPTDDEEREQAQPLLLIVEDDEACARTLARSFERRGYRVLQAASLPEVETLLAHHTPGFAVVDLKLKGEASGLARSEISGSCAAFPAPSRLRLAQRP